MARVRVNWENDGFSLMELLAVLVIVSIIFFIAIYMYNGVISNSKDEIDDQSRDMIMDAVDVYVEEFRGNENWKEGNDIDDQLSFCVDIQSLINFGYYKGNENTISEWKDKYLVKVIVEEDGYSYELVDKNKRKVCDVATDDVIVSNQNGDYKFSDDGVEVATFKYLLTQKDDFVYNIDNVIKANILPKIDGEIKSYITLVLDRSGSMKNEYTKEELAARCLTARLLGVSAVEAGLRDSDCKNVDGAEGLKKAEVSLIEFALRPYLSRDFEYSILPLPLGIYDSKKNPNAIFHKDGWTGVDGKSGIGGGTNTAYALAYAMMLNQKLPKDGKKFIILLYDGEPCSSIYYTEGSGKNKVTYYPFDSRYANNINTTFFDNLSDKFEQNLIKTTKNDYCGLNKRGGKDLIAVSNYLKNNTDITLIVVGYKSNFDNNFKILSSQDNSLCSDSSYATDTNKDKVKEWYCYYKSDKNSLGTLFNSLSNNLVREINNNSATLVEVILTPPDNVKFFMNGIEQDKIIYTIDLIDDTKNNINYNYDIEINNNIFESCTDTSSCSVEVEMFNANVIYYNKDGDIIKESSLEQTPKINLTYDKFLAIN